MASKEKCVSEKIPKTDHLFYKLYWLWKHVTHRYVQTQRDKQNGMKNVKKHIKLDKTKMSTSS
jgi:hypothetical protein